MRQKHVATGVSLWANVVKRQAVVAATEKEEKNGQLMFPDQFKGSLDIM